MDKRLRPARPLPERGTTGARATSTLPSEICTKRAEGFALYSLYPRAIWRPSGSPTRSCATHPCGRDPQHRRTPGSAGSRGLAPPPLTLRPIGEPPHRQVAMAEDLAAELLADAGSVRFAVVDEGPGLSGSSVRRGRRLPRGSRRGTGADPLLREPCRAAGAVRAPPPSPALGQGDPTCGGPRDPAGPLPAAAGAPARNLVADLVGPTGRLLEEISGGRWRRYATRTRRTGPPATSMSSAASSCCAGSGTWLLKFGIRAGWEDASWSRAQGLPPPVRPRWPVGYRHAPGCTWIGAHLLYEIGIFERLTWLVPRSGLHLGFRPVDPLARVRSVHPPSRL